MAEIKVALIDVASIHRGLNTGLGYLASSITMYPDIQVNVFDFNNRHDSIRTRLEEIEKHDIVGFSVKSTVLPQVLNLVQTLSLNNSTVIAGGPHITLDGINFMSENPVFDFAFKGEAEQSLSLFIKGVSNDKIPGLISRKEPLNNSPERIEDLDSLPFPAYGKFDSVSEHISNYPLVTSRGCPYNCTFCCVKRVMGRKWIARSVPNIIEELSYVKKRFGVHVFNIQDDNFSMDINRAMEFCEALLQKDFKFTWSCPNGVRADRLDEELLKLMKRAGCHAIAIGVESNNAEEFNSIKKGETLEHVIWAAQKAKEIGMEIYGNFIIGLPHATLDSVRQSVMFAKEKQFNSAIFNLLVPFPGTEIYEWVKKEGKLLMPWQEAYMQGAGRPKIVFETPEFPKEEREKVYFEANVALHNYFALMDEGDSSLGNILKVIEGIWAYDRKNVVRHIVWFVKNLPRVFRRLIYKNR
jgi:radical SAM superfamily enzyme YgiQ (UPF0313 family)